MAEFVIIFIIFVISTIFIRKLLKKQSSRTLPPGPSSLPIIGHLHYLSQIPHQALAKLSSRYGPLIHIYLGSIPCIVVSSADFAKEVLKTQESSFSDRTQTSVTDYLTYGSQDFTTARYGPYWKFMKKLCMSQLLNGQTLDLLQPVRRHEVKQLVDLFADKANAGKSVEVGNEVIRMTNNAISRMIMSARCSGGENDAEVVRKVMEDTAELAGKFNLSDYIWFCKNLDLQGFGKRLKAIRGRFDEMMEKIIDEHQTKRRKLKEGTMEGEVVKDLLDILLDIAEDEGSEWKLSSENIKAFILNLFVAGTYTSAITVEWTLAELINHPNMMQKAVEEIDSVVGKNRLVEESDIPNLPYLQALVKESLRLHPTGPFILRECNKDCIIAGYQIPAKTRLIVNTWAIARDPNHWENVLEFKPERFLGSDGSGKGQLDVRGQHYELLPFGSGRRGCPGTSLALQVVHTALAALIQCFEWKVEGGSGSLDMDERAGIAMRRANPLVCYPVPRINPIPSV